VTNVLAIGESAAGFEFFFCGNQPVMLPRIFSARGALVLLTFSNLISWWCYFSAAQDHWVCVHALERCAPQSPSSPCSASAPPSTGALQSNTSEPPESERLGPEFVPRGGGDVILWESFDRDLLFSDERQYKVSPKLLPTPPAALAFHLSEVHGL
jgi:hypothetical protein